MNSLQTYKAVILAGGKGTRLYPVTKEIPKPLLPVARKPIINYLADLFLAHGISDIAVLISHDFRDDFEWWLKRYYPQQKIELIEEPEPLGTFGGLWLIKDWLANSPFFLTNGDELKEINLNEMAELHEKSDVLGTLALVKVPNPQDYGVVLCNSEKVYQFLEKPKEPPTDFISSGLYLLSQEILSFHPGPKFTMIEKDIFPRLAQEGKLAGFKFIGKWMDCGTWERYSKALDEWNIK